jgi:cation diffusion facilitator CzcD-associated flavoprotein CzcO/amino acid transporter
VADVSRVAHDAKKPTKDAGNNNVATAYSSKDFKEKNMNNTDDLVKFTTPNSKPIKQLSTARVIFLVIAAAAPLGAIVGNVPLALGGSAGIGMPVGFLIVGLILACFAAGYAAMSREIISTGAFYTYIGQGLGKPAGIVAAYCSILAYGGYAVGLAAAFGYFVSLLFGQLGMVVPWMPCALVGIALIAIVGYRSLDFSARMLAFFMVAEFGILLAFDIAVLLKHGLSALPAVVWQPSSFLRPELGAVIPFIISSFVGFESAALYGEETAQPKKSIPRATYAALAAITLFYLFTVWVIIGAVGAAQITPYAHAQGGNLLFTLSGMYGGDLLTSLMGAFFVTSLLASYLALHNVTSRYLFALGRDGLLPAQLAAIHPQHHSPFVGSLTITALELLIVIGFGLAGASPYLGIASGAIGFGTIGIIAMQLACAFAVVGYYRRAPRADRLTTRLLPLIGGTGLTVCLALTLHSYSSLTGSTNPLINLLPWAYLPLFAAALLYARWLRRQRPAVYAKVASSQRRIETTRRARANVNYSERYCIIGAGPAGLVMARALLKEGVPFDCFERNVDVGGIWDPDHAGSPMYESAHFISSKWTSYFYGFPMPDSYPDYPSYRQILDYIRAFARHYGLHAHIQFNCEITSVVQLNDQWQVTLSSGETRLYAGVIAAPGVTWHASMPTLPGMDTFGGEIRHTVSYRTSDEFKGRRVLIVGCGNSGVDIACDAAQVAEQAFLSVRRGYRFVPKHLFGIPTDVMMQGHILPPKGVALSTNINQMLDGFSGDLTRLGLPKPDHDALSSHPIMNTQILHYLAHGDIRAKGDIAEFQPHGVLFKDGSVEDVDLVMFATGYNYKLPCIDPALFTWKDGRPQLYLNIIHRELSGLYVLGFAEFADSAYRRFDEMAQLIVADIHARTTGEQRDWLDTQRQTDFPDLRGGKTYLDSPRHANYVDSETYQKILANIRHHLGWPDLTDQSFDAQTAGQPSPVTTPENDSNINYPKTAQTTAQTAKQ